MSLAERLRSLRQRAGLSLDDLAVKANISKTYLWELEKDESGTKKPSADILMRIANALSVTIAELLSLPTVTVKDAEVQIPAALQQLQQRLLSQGTTLSDQDLRDLASMRFRGGQPRTVDDWHQLYLTLVAATRRKKP
jgi:transcriptional regulator with XRE-family HTH domain